jgi:hypothetical protein
MSAYALKKIVKEMVIEAGFKYLLEKKNEPGKHTKIAHLQYSKLKLQEYLLDGNNGNIKIIFVLVAT